MLNGMAEDSTPSNKSPVARRSVMKKNRGAMKSLMMGTGLVCLLSVNAGAADAREVWPVGASISRPLSHKSAREDLGQRLSTCWASSGCVVAVSARGWDKEMVRVQGQMCVLPSPSAPTSKENNW